MKAPDFPAELHPYDHKILDDVLSVLSWQIGRAIRSGYLNGYEDTDQALMGLLIECGVSNEKVHRAFSNCFRDSYDERRTEQMYQRTKGKIEGGEAIRGAGSLIQKIREHEDLKTLERFIGELQRIVGHKKSKKGDLVDIVDFTPDSEIFPLYPFPFNVFPQELVMIIERYSDALHVEPEIVASAMLSIISGALGNTIRISPKPGYEVAPFIWLIVIMLTGAGKSPLLQALLKPIMRMQSKAYLAYQEDQKSYEQGLRKAKQDPSAEIQEKPRLNHYHVSDCTVEALSGVFENDRRGVIINLDELSGLILGLDQYKGKGNDRQHYLELFNADSWKIDRKAGVKFIPNTGASIIGGIQPKVMPIVFNADSFDDGFLPRFLLVHAESNEMRFNRKGIDAESSELWRNLLEWIYKKQLTEDESGFIKPQMLTLSDRALDVWEAFYNNYGGKMPFLSDRGKVFIPKLTAYYSLKFAGIIHCLREYSSSRPIENTISPETITHAIQLTHFFIGQAMRILGLYEGKTPPNEYQKRLIHALYSLRDTVKHGKLSVSEITGTLNSNIPEDFRITPKKTGSLLKGLGLETEESTGGIFYLIWEPQKITKLFSEKMSTKSTKSTIPPEGEAFEAEKVDKVDIVDFDLENEKVEFLP